MSTVWTVEHGLSHIHIIIFLHHKDKLHIPEDINSLLSAEFPRKDEEPELFELVKKFMVHTHCSTQNPTALCMHNEKCSKDYPKPFREERTINEDSYANLRRCDTGKKVKVGEHEFKR